MTYALRNDDTSITIIKLRRSRAEQPGVHDRDLALIQGNMTCMNTGDLNHVDDHRDSGCFKQQLTHQTCNQWSQINQTLVC
jgi:hypothetical protein